MRNLRVDFKFWHHNFNHMIRRRLFFYTNLTLIPKTYSINPRNMHLLTTFWLTYLKCGSTNWNSHYPVSLYDCDETKNAHTTCSHLTPLHALQYSPHFSIQISTTKRRSLPPTPLFPNFSNRRKDEVALSARNLPRRHCASRASNYQQFARKKPRSCRGKSDVN